MLFNWAWVTVFVKLVLASSETPILCGWHRPRLWPLPPPAHVLFTLHSWASSQVCSPRQGYFPPYRLDSLRPLIQALTKPRLPVLGRVPLRLIPLSFLPSRPPAPPWVSRLQSHVFSPPRSRQLWCFFFFLILTVNHFQRHIRLLHARVPPYSPYSGRPHVGIFCLLTLR